MDALLDLLCQFSPGIGASVLAALAMIALVTWRGGTVDKIKIPGVFDVALNKPIVFTGSRFFLVVSILAILGAIALGIVQAKRWLRTL
jgi:hypothetical protein